MFQRETRKNPNEIICIYRGGRGETLVKCLKNNPIVLWTAIGFQSFFVVCLVLFLVPCLWISMDILAEMGPPTLTSVIKLQVGLLGSAKSVREDFNLIAMKQAKNNLKEATVTILRRLDYCISGYSFVGINMNMENCLTRFHIHSIEEGGKLHEDALANSNNMKNGTGSNESTEVNNEYIVVTLLVAAKGLHWMPAIHSSENVKEALRSVGSIAPGKMLDVEFLLNPQSNKDTLTERDMLKHYSHLRLYK